MLALDAKPFFELPATMSDAYGVHSAAHHSDGPLEDFQSLINRKYSGSYTHYFSEHAYDPYRLEETSAAVYHELHAPKDYAPTSWKSLDCWSGDDVMSWLLEVAQDRAAPIRESEIPFCNFRDLSGYTLRMLTREDVRQLMYFPAVSRESARHNGDVVYAALERLRGDGAVLPRDTVLRSSGSGGAGGYYYEPQLHDMDAQLHDMDSQQLGLATCPYLAPPSLADELRPHGSPDYSGSDASKSGDEEERRAVKRSPGRPRGSGKKPHGRVKNVSVPEFLASLLADRQYCPATIKWENYKIAQFRFVKPDEVAKLWGFKKQNKNMSFEKFSRAMRYHYKNGVLKSVPTARLVYQFGENGKHLIRRTDDPNFEHIMVEHNVL